MGKVRIILEMIKFEHSIFALPFALAGLFLASEGWPAPRDLWWVVVAMVGARSLAMTLNRLIDQDIDARNPRTASRALPAGLLRRRETWAFAGAAFALLLLAVLRLHPLTRWGWPIVVGLFVFYPYTKRFTWACHFVLGACLGLAPVGAWVAVTGKLASPIWLLGAGVLCWTAGFDVIYSCQDLAIDLEQGLHSLPARFGPRPGLAAARLAHVAALGFFAGAGAAFHLHALYYAGLLVVAALLVGEHRLVSPCDFSELNTAFFTMNGAIAGVFFLFTAADLVLPMGRA